MASRLEILKSYIDKILDKIPDSYERRCAYIHLYGVSQACTLLALKRGEDAELAAMAGMLHDLYTYKFMDSKKHAEKGAVLAGEVLAELKITTENETDMICSAIHNHSAKGRKFSPFDEILIDADVLQHCIYDVNAPIAKKEKERFQWLVDELGLLSERRV